MLLNGYIILINIEYIYRLLTIRRIMMNKILIIVIILGVVLFGVNDLADNIGNDNYTFNKDLVSQVSKKTPNYITIDKMPEDLVNGVISIEDRRFKQHLGFDIIGIIRAAIVNVRAGEIVEGGSTITQQLAKNLFLTEEKTLKRKLKELILAIKIEMDYSKEDIIEMYLNIIYFGSESYGVYEASREYFNKDVEDLTLKECAMLAGIIKSPSYYNPKNNIEMAKKRQIIVIDSMINSGYIDKMEKELVFEY